MVKVKFGGATIWEGGTLDMDTLREIASKVKEGLNAKGKLVVMMNGEPLKASQLPLTGDVTVDLVFTTAGA